MKKQFKMSLLSAISMLIAFTLSSCSENDNTGSGTNQTVFVMENDGGTRTSMNPERFFFWEKGDKIWVNDNGTWISSTSSNVVTGAAEEAKFVINASLGDNEYPVLYTGYLNGDTAQTMSSHVTIASLQTQKAANDATHLGSSGDCGVATASKRPNGTYKFHLYHKAHYLILQPYVASTLVGSYKLETIEITADGTTLAGSYTFSASGLNTENVTNASSTVTLNCTDGFTIDHNANNSCFMVIQPGTHALKIKYTLRAISGTGADGSAPTFEKNISVREYAVGAAVTIKHELKDAILVFDPKYYQWDAVNEYGSATGAEYNPVRAAAGVGAAATRSCAIMPNANAMYSYAFYGDPRWDNTTKWMVVGDPTIYTGGAWILKKDYIGNSFGATAGADGVDMRTTEKHPSNTSNTYRTGGKPTTDLYKYFFLPAVGAYSFSTSGEFYHRGSLGRYWSSTAVPGFTGSLVHAYAFNFSENSIGVSSYNLNNSTRPGGNVVGTGWFQ